MFFGSKSTIGIECGVTSWVDQWVYGNICFWVTGEAVGQYEETVTLGVAAFYLRRTLRYVGQRHQAAFEKLTAEEALEFPQNGLINGGFQSTSEADHFNTKICIFPNGCEAFDNVRAVLLEQSIHERFIWKSEADQKAHQAFLPIGEYKTVVRSFLDWVVPTIGDDPLSYHYDGILFVFAGHFINPTRKGLEALVRRFGGEVVEQVTEDVSYVVVGNVGREGNSRAIQASALNVSIITVDEFMTMLPSLP